MSTPSENWTFARVLHLMDEQGRTGVLCIETTDTMTRIHVRRGYVCYVEMERGGDRWLLGDYLVQTGTASPRAIMSARKEATQHGVPIEEALIRRGVTSEDLIKRFADLEVSENLFPLFRETGLNIRFLEERPKNPEWVSPLPVSYILREADRRATTWPALRQRVGHRSAVYRREAGDLAELLGYVEPAPGTEDSLPEVSAGARITYFHTDGIRSVEEVARCSGMGLFETYRAMMELLDGQLLTLVATHSQRQEVDTHRSYLPTIVSFATYLLLAGIMFLGVQWILDRGEIIRNSLFASSPEIDLAMDEAHYHLIHEALQIRRVGYETYPERLEDLLEEDYISEDTATIVELLDYIPGEAGYILTFKP